jgi:hypothetical protein
MKSLVEVDKQEGTMFLKVGNDRHKKKPDGRPLHPSRGGYGFNGIDEYQ